MLLKRFDGTMLAPGGVYTVCHSKTAILSWHVFMNFIIHATFAEFVEDLPKESIVYYIAVSQYRQQIAYQVVILSSEAGSPGGTIHAIRLIIEPEQGEEDAATRAAMQMAELLRLKGMICRRGVLLTEGLNDALESYKLASTKDSLKILDALIAKEKEGKPK